MINWVTVFSLNVIVSVPIKIEPVFSQPIVEDTLILSPVPGTPFRRIPTSLFGVLYFSVVLVASFLIMRRILWSSNSSFTVDPSRILYDGKDEDVM